MKWKIAAMALCGTMAGVPAWSQTPGQEVYTSQRMPQAPAPSQPGTDGASAPSAGGNRVYSAASALPGPTPDEEIKPASVAFPDDPLEPYLLTKGNGPFMVLAKVFRGPDAEKMALVLCKELQQDFGLPAYILRSKEFPMKSYIRGTPVQAPSMTSRAAIKQPEAIRIQDEAAVLVGDEKTLQGSELLLHKVKKLQPKCLEGMPVLFKWREGGGLSRALRTTNPYVPAQVLYPKTADRLIVQMNSGLRSIANCPGHYTLQVAMFTGRTAFDLNAPEGTPTSILLNPRESPLKTAHRDAEHLAEKLAKSEQMKRIGQPVYVYHDRTSSRVYVGAFNSPQDPAIAALHADLLKAAWELNAKDSWGRAKIDERIVPASQLTDVDGIKTEFH
jgi:hypothetical protein